MPNRKSLGGRVLFWFMGFLDFRPLLLGSELRQDMVRECVVCGREASCPP